MELEGKISVVMPAASGVSQSTGNQWMSQEYVLAYYWFPNQTTPSYIVMRVFGEDRIKQFNLQPNDEVRVRFHIEAHEYNGRWFNDTRLDAVTFVGASAEKNRQHVAQEPTPPAEPTQEQREAMERLKNMGEQAATGNENGSKEDDMPF